jgi:beta-phosphoglucomutase-like phosphatase (HAD superfamily)
VKARVIFIDDGDVLTDNVRRAAEWRRLIGEYLVPRLGGTPEAWAAANTTVFDAQLKRFFAWLAAQQGAPYENFFQSRQERVRWLSEMCEIVGVATPPPTECDALSRDLQEYIMPRVRAPMSGARAGVRTLHERGFPLATASGALSTELHHALNALGLRDYFPDDRLFGPDLVRAHKGTPEFYPRIFERASVQPRDALVIDNDPRMLDLAASIGAATAIVSNDGAQPHHANVRSLAEVPSLLDTP